MEDLCSIHPGISRGGGGAACSEASGVAGRGASSPPPHPPAATAHRTADLSTELMKAQIAGHRRYHSLLSAYIECRKDNGGCNFFEWCDAPSPGPANAHSNTVFQSDTSPVNRLCPCGAGICLILTTKAGVNVGRQFYRCPAQGGSSCGFFKWCDDQQLRTAAPLQSSPRYRTDVTSTNQSISKSSSSCFKCGQENHWAKDSPNQSSDPYSDKGGRTLTSASSSDARLKCGKAGHWSRDCPAANCGVVPSPAMSNPLVLWPHGTATDTDRRYL